MPTLLVVDDQPKMHEMLDLLLADTGWDLINVEEAASAIIRFREGGVDVVLTDLHMPGLDGLEMLESFRQHDPDVVAILMTGDESRDSLIRSIKAGTFDFLPKPFSAAEVQSIVNRAYEERQRRRKRIASVSSDSETSEIEQRELLLREREAFLQQSEDQLMERMEELLEREHALERREASLRNKPGLS